MNAETCAVTCPACFEIFEVPAPPIVETLCEVDYDCEVCCRPMTIRFEPDDGGGLGTVVAEAFGLAD